MKTCKIDLILFAVGILCILTLAIIERDRFNTSVSYYENEGYNTRIAVLFTKVDLGYIKPNQEFYDIKED